MAEINKTFFGPVRVVDVFRRPGEDCFLIKRIVFPGVSIHYQVRVALS